jgi:rhodanese-related sulfurtransferase
MLAELPDGFAVLPTHGEGSFCTSVASGGRRTTTIGAERRSNPLLRAPDEASFAASMLASATRFPSYYARMAPLNRAGAPVRGRLEPLSRLDAAGLVTARDAGARVVDGRPRQAFAAAHIPGSLNVELLDSFASYVGWLVDFEAPLVLVLPDPVDEAADEAHVQLFRIGREQVAGVLDGGIDAWAAAGHPTSSYPTTTMAEVEREIARGNAPRLLDVRQPFEWRDEGTVAGSTTIFVADLADRLGELDGDAYTVLCKSGQRAAMAASLLDEAGTGVRLVARGGAGA